MLLHFVRRRGGGVTVMTDNVQPLLTRQMERQAQLNASADTKGQARTPGQEFGKIKLHEHISRMHLEETCGTHSCSPPCAVQVLAT